MVCVGHCAQFVGAHPVGDGRGTRPLVSINQPRPTNGMLVAITVVNKMLADKGRRAMVRKVSTTADMSMRGSALMLRSAWWTP